MSVSRRHFLGMTSAATLGFKGLHTLFANTGHTTPAIPSIPFGYGELKNDPEGIIDLPEGFTYKIIARRGDTMSDGFRIPGLPDGMAAFPAEGGRTVVVCNHEMGNGPVEHGPYGDNNELFSRISPNYLFDAGKGVTPCLGGTTNIVYNTKTQQVEKQFLSLAGTVRNCAGGPTPWNTWITCEETVQRADDEFEKDHGYNFEVPASTIGGPVVPLPLMDMGRFNHEAVAVDRHSGAVYQTEDRHDGLIYRYLPNVPGRLYEGGRLQALVIKGMQGVDTRNWEETTIERGVVLEVEWIDLEDIHSPEDDMRYRGTEAGAAVFARGEGMWASDTDIYFACTNGGSAKKGQIWKYTPSVDEGRAEENNAPGTLELFVEPNDGGLMDNADNLTVSPWGDLIVCEDGSGEQNLVGVSPQGELYRFGHNAMSGSELAGATFSPDGSTLFVNIQSDGLTLAITGPWRTA